MVAWFVRVSTFLIQLTSPSSQEMAPTGQRPLLKDILGPRMMIMWEEQLVDPPIAYLTDSLHN